MRQLIIQPISSPVQMNEAQRNVDNIKGLVRDEISKATQVKKGTQVTACDGLPLITVNDGTSCHTGANDGTPVLSADFGGSQISLVPIASRGSTSNAGYDSGLLSDSVNEQNVQGAVDNSENDGTFGTVDEPEGLGDIDITDITNRLASIAGLAGTGTDLYAITYDSGTYEYRLWYYADVTSADPAVQVTTSYPCHYIVKISTTRAIGISSDYPDIKLLIFDSGVETDTHTITSFGNTSGPSGTPAAGRYLVALPDGNSVALTGSKFQYVSGLTIDDNKATILVIKNLLSGTIAEVAYSITGYAFMADRAIDVSDDGTIYADFYQQGAYAHELYRWDFPYSAIPSVRAREATGTTVFYQAVRVSPDNSYIICTEGGNTAWRYARLAGNRTSIANGGYTISPAGNFIEGLSQKLWLLANITGTAFALGYEHPYDSTPSDEIELGTGTSGFVGITANDSVMCVAGNSSGGFRMVMAPFTSSSVPADVSSPDASGDVVVIATPSELGYDGVNLSIKLDTVTSEVVTGLIQVTASFTWTATVSAFNVVITIPLPSDMTFVSADNDGSYDSVTRKVTWNLGSVSSTDTGTVGLVITLD